MFQGRKKRLGFIILLTFVSITACSNPEKKQENHKEESLKEVSLKKECTYEHVTFYVGDNWSKIDDIEGAFVYPDNKSVYML